VVPPAIAALFNYFLPRLMRWLSKFMGTNTFSNLDHVVIARYFTFLVISQLIIFTAIGVLFRRFPCFWFYARIYLRPCPQIPFWRSSAPFGPKPALTQSLTTSIVWYPLLADFDSLRFLAIVELPARITRTYVDQAPFWLKWFPCVISQFFDILG